MIYCDTSFLLALYVEADAFHEKARRIASRFASPILYTLLGELELRNGIHRLKGSRGITAHAEKLILNQIAMDKEEGFLVRAALNQAEHYKAAKKLSDEHTPSLLSRSLDILHVAAATILEAESFVSFDLRQRKLARAVGLAILPGAMADKK